MNFQDYSQGFARCSLAPCFQWKVSDRYLTNYDSVKQIVEDGGGTEGQWTLLGHVKSSISGSLQKTLLSTIASFMPDPVLKMWQCSKEQFQELKQLEDQDGRNCLQIPAHHQSVLSGNEYRIIKLTADEKRMMHLVVKNLLAVGVQIDHHDDTRETPLMAHVRCGASSIANVRCLLEASSNLNARNYEGECALHISMKLGDIDTTRLLLTQGTNLYPPDNRGQGVIEAAGRAQRRTNDNRGLYAKIAACMKLAIDAGAVALPNLFQEWSSPAGDLDYICDLDMNLLARASEKPFKPKPSPPQEGLACVHELPECSRAGRLLPQEILHSRKAQKGKEAPSRSSEYEDHEKPEDVECNAYPTESYDSAAHPTHGFFSVRNQPQ